MSSHNYETLKIALQILSVIIIAISSYFLRKRLAGHSLSIDRISPFSLALYNIQYKGILYSGTYHFKLNCSNTHIHFHWPSPTLPRWLSLNAQTILYQSDTADISVENLVITFWIFPQLFKQTAGPWTNVELDGLRIRVRQSQHTPYFVKRIRENLVGAIIGGDIFRLDDFRTTLQFCGLTERYSDQEGEGEACRAIPDHQGKFPDADGNADDCIGTLDGEFNMKPCHRIKTPLPWMNPDQDEVRVSAFAREVHLCNNEGRIYTFGAVDAQLRRNWMAQRGTFVMIAKESRWIRVHWNYQREQLIPWWMELVSAIVQFPYNLVHALHYPLTTVNLYVPKLDVHFDEFRIRDAELMTQTFGMIREQMHPKDIAWQDVFVDAVTRAIIGTGTSKA